MIDATKERGPVPGASPAESKLPASTVTAVTTTKDTPRSGRLDRLVLRDDVLFDSTIPTTAKLVLGANAPHPHRPPRFAEINAVLPCLDKGDHAAGTKYVASARLAFVERHNAKRKPNRFRRLAPHVNTWQGERSVHIPTRSLHNLRGRGAKEAILLYAVYCIEQQRRLAVQLSDDVAAHRLGWTPDKAKRWRKSLEDAGLIRVHRKASGRNGAIYGVPDAFFPFEPEQLDETRTPRLTTVVLDDGTAIPVCASDAQKEVIETRLTLANEQDVEALRAFTADAQASNPRRGHIDARELLDGPLYGIGLDEVLADANYFHSSGGAAATAATAHLDSDDVPV